MHTTFYYKILLKRCVNTSRHYAQEKVVGLVKNIKFVHVIAPVHVVKAYGEVEVLIPHS